MKTHAPAAVLAHLVPGSLTRPQAGLGQVQAPFSAASCFLRPLGLPTRLGEILPPASAKQEGV